MRSRPRELPPSDSRICWISPSRRAAPVVEKSPEIGDAGLAQLALALLEAQLAQVRGATRLAQLALAPARALLGVGQLALLGRQPLDHPRDVAALVVEVGPGPLDDRRGHAVAAGRSRGRGSRPARRGRMRKVGDSVSQSNSIEAFIDARRGCRRSS